MLASLMVFAAPASASTLSWGAETVMDSTSTYENTLVDPNGLGLDIIDVAANGDIVYAATNNTTTPLFKSTDGGVKWSGLQDTTSFPAGLSVKAIAVASDDSDAVAIVTSANEVEYSTNGGSSWTDLNNPTNSAGANITISAIDIAPGSTRYIAVGGALGGAAELYTIKLAISESWVSRYIGKNGIAGGQTDIKAVKYSPNYSTDKALAVISGNATSSTFQLFRYETGDYEWNKSIDYLGDADASWTGGIVLTPATPLSGIVGGLAAADIVMPSTFLANDEGERLVYTAIAGTTSGGGIIRLTDIVQKDFQTWSGGDTGSIGSLAYDEDGKLYGGAYATNRVYQYLSPMATTPKATRVNTLKQPGGASVTVLTLSSGNIVAGTSGDESAISLSTDDGYSFNDLALIDTDDDV